ncbi:MAG: fasciclin domain-containing protein, partial [Hafnia sp.]
ALWCNILRRIVQKKSPRYIKTVNGQEIWLMQNGPHNIQIKDANGGVANISTYDVQQKNGVIDVIDKVLLPK